MKNLVLIRHAKSSWKFPELKDSERPLNNRGEKEAPLMGKVLKKLSIRPDLILTSPAKRAVATAKIVSRKLGYEKKAIKSEPLLYLNTNSEIIQLINKLDNHLNTVIVFGHNPMFTELANELSNSSIDNLPTSGAFGIQFDCENWSEVNSGKGKLLFFEFPKKYKKKKSEKK